MYCGGVLSSQFAFPSPLAEGDILGLLTMTTPNDIAAETMRPLLTPREHVEFLAAEGMPISDLLIIAAAFVPMDYGFNEAQMAWLPIVNQKRGGTMNFIQRMILRFLISKQIARLTA